MTDTFNPVEIAEDNGLTIAQLVAQLRAQRDQLSLDCQELQNEAAETREQMAQRISENISLHADVIAINQQFENYQRSAVARYQDLENALDSAMQDLHNARKQSAQPIDQVVSKYVTDLVSSLLEGNDIRALIEQSLEQQIERTLSNSDLVKDMCVTAIDTCLEEIDIECEDHVREAIEEQLQHVEITFGRRC